MTHNFDLNAALSTPADNDILDQLQAGLAKRALGGDLLDIGYTTIDTPVGPLLLAATPKGLIRVAYASQDHDLVLETLAQQVSPRILRAPARLDPAARELDEYFAGSRRTFDLDLDLSLSRGFRGLVQRHLPDIGYGETRSYGQLAALVGSPRAARAVGTACATNPLPVIVPCHRVVPADGGVGNYIGGPEAKAALLRLEAA